MITINRLRHRWVHIKAWLDSRRAINQARRIKARTLRRSNPGYDELSNPLFIGVMTLAVAVLLVDTNDAWSQLGYLILALGDLVRLGA